MTGSNGKEKGVTYRIAVDAMGGDFAPAELVKGALLGAKKSGVQILLVGDRPAVAAELKRLGAEEGAVVVVPSAGKDYRRRTPSLRLYAKIQGPLWR